MPLEYYNGKKCVPLRDLEKHGVMTAANYRQMVHRGDLTVARSGGGKGNYVLIVVDSSRTDTGTRWRSYSPTVMP